MNTPICDFVEKYARSDVLRLHVPGHKGKGTLGTERIDITEIEGADVLYGANGIIEQSQKNAASLFDTEKTLYSCEGSSLSIRAMLYLAMLASGQSPDERSCVLAVRNAHKSFLSAAVLLDLDIEWLYPENAKTVVCGEISPERLDAAISAMEKKPIAFYLTSPDYIGNISDIRELCRVCHGHGVLFICDNAHGAYLRFLPTDLHPITLGADMCCDSAHKTLPALTGAGYLHISKNAPAVIAENAKRAMSLFASTSPSYLILQSLDMLNTYLAGECRSDLCRSATLIEGLKSELATQGFKLCGNEPAKLTVSSCDYGYSGIDVAEHLRSFNIECEFADPDFVVLMFGIRTSAADISRVRDAFLSLPRRNAIASSIEFRKAKTQMSVRRAMLSPSQLLDIAECDGRVLADADLPCPPAIPIAVCGELIDKNKIELFRYYGIEKIRVVCR